MAGARDVICPYCFETWSTATAAYRCLGAPDDPRCPREPDEAQARHLGGEPVLQKRVVLRTARFGRALRTGKGNAECDCGARTTPVCPHCHSGLPHGYAEGGDRLIGLIGTKASGKSHYIAVLMHELFQSVGARFDAVVELLDDETRRRYEAELVRPLYREGVVLPATPTAATDARVRQPLGLRLAFPNGKAQDVVNAVFFDTAGEDLSNDAVLDREARYVGQCSALILLIDPLQVTGIRELVGSTVPLPDEVVDPLVVLRSVTELLRRRRGIAAPQRLPQPLAIAFSKLDAIGGLFDDGSPVLGDPSSSGAFDVAESRSVGAVLRAQLVEWLGPDFDAYTAQHYERCNYFGVSALGAQPDGDGKLRRDVAPHRVTDPLLWVLSEWGTIPTRS
jgi:hypothetical protein